MKRLLFALLVLTLVLPGAAEAKKNKKKKKADAEAAEKADESKLNSGTFAGLRFRGIGPALTSGRIGDLAVHPEKHHVYYAAVASGGVWKTENDGTTWTSIFDGQGSYSIGCITLDPNDPQTVWVGTGENNSQRSVSYGDGVYKSLDGGKTWKNVGLKDSEHIGKILVDPRDSDVVWVAAQGPLWADGGDRGLYKTTDGGETWKKVLEISERTGVSDIAFDPRDPDVVYAAAYQRRRRVWTLINGGPESAIHKTTDGGESWSKLAGGLPGGDVGRIGIAVAPTQPDWVYAIIEGRDGKGGFYRSTDSGSTWEKRGDHVSGSPQYYQEIFVDPHDPERVYSMSTFFMVTEDAGRSFRPAGERSKHVDNHALWIDPGDPDHLLIGTDGGVYESHDRAATWQFKANLPITQFYRVTVDNAFPFYNVYGGTQDNFSLAGPSRTVNAHGIDNSDWFVTQGGDGFKTVIDPEDHNIVYAQYQYAGIARFDKRSGEGVDIQPQAAPGEEPLRWNWDSPLIISPHLHTRLYFGAQRLYRSDDRGNSWTAVSGDLTRDIDRNELEVMGRVWSVDAVAKNVSTSFFGTLIAVSESPLAEGLLVTGSDDGLVQISEDGGGAWRKVTSEEIASDLKMTYVSDVEASRHDVDTIYVAFDAHKDGDFKPYLYKSSDRGRTWASISGDLPERGTVYSMAEDAENPNLLFAGTEFGAFFTLDGGKRWVQLKAGVPPIAVKELVLQDREVDLVLGTFGRGFYILDDYSPLRHVDEAKLEEDAVLFPVKKTWMFVEANPIGGGGKAFQGESFYTAPNPPNGAVLTYYLKDGLKTRKAKRQMEEGEKQKEGEDTPYPSWDSLRAEDREKAPGVALLVQDEEGNLVRVVEGPSSAGFHRVTWDLRYPAPDPTSLTPFSSSVPWITPPLGPMAAPGRYSATLVKWVDGNLEHVGERQSFEIVPLGWATLAAEDKEALEAFQRKAGRLQRAVLGANRAAGEARERLDYLDRAVFDTPGVTPELAARVDELRNELLDLMVVLQGDPTVGSRMEPTAPSILGRIGRVTSAWTSTSAPTQTHRDSYRWAAEAFGELLPKLSRLIEEKLVALEADFEAAGAPWTPGRVPDWQPE